jgi:hypothetical protein
MDEASAAGSAARRTVQDMWFGSVTITPPREGMAQVRVEGPALPVAMIVRDEETRDHAQAPLGTRDEARLTMTVGGDTAGLHLGAGRLKRSSFCASVDLPGRAYVFEPTSTSSSVLRRNGQQVASFISSEDGLSAYWRPEGTSPLAEDAAVGYLLAAAFGTGAASTGELVFEAFLELIGIF